MWFFNWTQDKNIRTLNPVWALVALVKEHNNTEILKKVVAKADGETTTERVQYNSQDVNNEDYKYSDDKTLLKKTRSYFTYMAV